MAVLGGSLLDPSGFIHIIVDVSRVYWIQLDPVGSMCILGGSMYILVDLSWIQLDPVGSLYILVEPLWTLVYPLLDPCRSLVYPLVSLYIHSIPINPLYPYQSTLIHSYPPYPSILYLLISILCNRSILPSSSRHY